MDKAEHPSRRIKVLRDEVARKIAAGEVIDRPLSVLRELLDNSLDAGATAIDVHWEAGGVRLLQVSDNGTGMDRQDLELCWLPHTTSKIESELDLDSLSSLGFRGEALASISACSRVSILTSDNDTGLGWELLLELGRAPLIRKSASLRGTRVRVEELFSNIPARRKFLKSAAAEGTLCRRVMDEKALSAPLVGFSLSVDGQRRFSWKAGSLKERVFAVEGEPWLSGEVIEFSAESSGCAVYGLSLAPGSSRSDRKGIRIFANGRPLQEYALVQAVGYAYEGYLPGGLWPYAEVFAEVDPSLVDFNIHPAKREARFRNAAELHRLVVQAIRTSLIERQISFPVASGQLQQPLALEATVRLNRPVLRGRAQLPSLNAWDSDQHLAQKPVPYLPSGASPAFRYLGQVLGVFLLAEVGDTLYLVDQHAAHERVLFDQYRAQKGVGQALLFPRRFQLESEAASCLRHQLATWEDLGIGIVELTDDQFELQKLPQLVSGMEKELIEFLEHSLKPASDVDREFYASLSCRAAVMDGDPLDPEAARKLLEQTFGLKHARCPHGRPIWTTLTRQDLFERVGRLA
jgi:DNA mismatch repair protein MutL